MNIIKCVVYTKERGNNESPYNRAYKSVITSRPVLLQVQPVGCIGL